MDRLRGLGDRARSALATSAAAELHAVSGQLAAPRRAEYTALAAPETTLDELIAAEDDGRRLASPTAEWMLILEDGISDLDDELEHEVAQRLLAVKREAEQTVTSTDPASSWDEFEAALTRRTTGEVGAASQLLVEGANRLAGQIAEYFSEHEAVIAPTLSGAPSEPVPAQTVGLESTNRMVWRSELLDAGWGGIEAMGAIAGMLSISVLNPFTLVVGVLMGGKSIHQLRQRELEQRRQQAMDAVARYLEDAKQEADRQRKFALRRIRRDLRSSYHRRADALYRSARDSLAAARRAGGADQGGREQRAAELVGELTRLHTLDQRADELATAVQLSYGAGR